MKVYLAQAVTTLGEQDMPDEVRGLLHGLIEALANSITEQSGELVVTFNDESILKLSIVPDEGDDTHVH